MQRYKENFQRASILILDHGTEAKRKLFSHHLTKINTSLRQFLQANRHDIYHHFNLQKCCQCKCVSNYKMPKKKILNVSQMEVLFEKNGRINGHIKGHSNGEFCCRDIKGAIRVEVFDITILNFLLTNFCVNLYLEAYFQTNKHAQTFEDILNKEIHHLYHLWTITTKQCCIGGCPSPSKKKLLTDQQWLIMYDRSSSRCKDVCAYQAKAGLGLSCIDKDLQIAIFSFISQLKKATDAIVEIRNTISHATNAELSDLSFNAIYEACTTSILEIYKECGINTIEIQSEMEYIKQQKFNESLWMEKHSILLQHLNQSADVNEVNSCLHVLSRSL